MMDSELHGSTETEAASVIGVSANTLYRWRAGGIVPCDLYRQVQNRRLRYNLKALADWYEEGGVVAAQRQQRQKRKEVK
jgi:predicted site-specific integrase-resolvase